MSDRRVAQFGRRDGIKRRMGPKDRRRVQTPGNPLRRESLTGRRADDNQSFSLLPIQKKSTLKERVEALAADRFISRADVLDLLKEFGVTDVTSDGKVRRA